MERRRMSEGLGLPNCVTGLPIGSLALQPATSLFPGFGGDLTVPCAPPVSYMR